MENKANPNSVNNENEVVKKAAPPPMKKAAPPPMKRSKKGEMSVAATKAAKKAEEKKKESTQKAIEAPEIKEEPKDTTTPEIKDAPKAEAKEEKKAEAPVVVTPVTNTEVKEKSGEPEKEATPVVKTPDVSEKKKVEEISEVKEEPKVEESKKEDSVKEEAAVVAKESEKEKKPLVAPVAKKEKINSKNLKIIIPVFIVLLLAIILAVVLTSGKDELKPIVVTDANGVPMTDVNGDVITAVPETEIIAVTDSNGEIVKDANGKEVTTVVYKDVTVQVPVTDMNGSVVTDASGNTVTENITVNPTSNSGDVTDGDYIGTTSVLVTDGKGHTGVDEQGNPITTIVNVTEPTTIDIEPAKTEWKNTLGGSNNDKYEDVILTSDGCYITANVTSSKDGDFAQYKELGVSSPYTVLTKYNKDGSVVWQKAFGSTNGSLELVSLSPCDKGSFYAVGFGKAIEDLTIEGWYDGAVYKIDKNGNIDWVQKFGTSTVDIFNDVVTTADGGAVVVGSVGNNDGDAEGSGGKSNESRAIIMKYSSSGKLLWKQFAGGNMDTFVGVAEAKNGSLFVLGNFYSGKLFPALGKCDSGVIKYSKDGKIMKKSPIAGSGIDEFTGITATSDGGVVVCGSSDSADTTDSSFFKNDLASRGGYDSYIIKYSEDLVIKFVTPLRGQNNDTATSVIELSDGTYIMAGSTNSSTRDFKGVTTRGKKDIFVASFNNIGVLVWVRSFGGTENDGALALCKGSDGGYVVAGETYSKNVDLNGIAPYGGNGKSLAVMIKFPE